MVKRIAKYLLRTLLVLLALVILLPGLLYIPGIQNLLCRKAEHYVAEQTDMQLSIGRLRLAFPLRLGIEDLLITQNTQDTLLACRRFDLSIALGPLLHKKVDIRQLLLSGATLHYADTTSGLQLQANLGNLLLSVNDINLESQEANITLVRLMNGNIEMTLGPGMSDTTTVDTTTAQPWKAIIQKLKISNIDFSLHAPAQAMELGVELQKGLITDGVIDLGQQKVSIANITLAEGDYSYLTGNLTKTASAIPSAPPVKTESHESVSSGNNTAPGERSDGAASTPAATSAQEESIPWTLSVGQVRLIDNALLFGKQGVAPRPGFDPDYIRMEQINLTLDSIFNQGSTVSGHLDQLAFSERSGLVLRSMSGRFGMDSSRIYLADLSLHTNHSSLEADLQAGATLLKMDRKAPFKIRLAAELNADEMLAISPIPDPSIRQMLARKSLSWQNQTAGTLDDLQSQNTVNVPGYIHLTANGTLQHLLETKQASGLLRLDGQFRNMAFAKELIADTSLRRRIDIPALIALHGTAGIDHGRYSSHLRIESDGGLLALKGSFNSAAQSYEAEVVCDSLPLNHFLPADSLGLLSLRLEASGQGFDPLATGTRGMADLRVIRADYLGHEYRDISLNALLENHLFSGRLASEDDAVQFDFDLGGLLTKEQQQISLCGIVDTCDLYALRLTPEKIRGRLSLDLSASASADSTYGLQAVVSGIEIWNGWKKDTIRTTSIRAQIAPEQLAAMLTSGDLDLRFEAPVGTDSLSACMARTSQLMASQIRIGRFDMETLSRALPPFRLKATAGRDNILNNFLRTRGVAFGNLSMNVIQETGQPFVSKLSLLDLSSGGIVMDTVTFILRQQAKQLNYLLRMGNSPQNPNNIALIASYGDIRQNRILMNFLQKFQDGPEGFRFGIEASLQDSTITARMFPEHPIFGGEPWSVNSDNFLAYDLRGDIRADLALTAGEQLFAVKTDDNAILTLRMAGIDLAKTFSLFPGAPPVEGILKSNLALQTNDLLTHGTLLASGTISIADLGYDKQRIGTTDLTVGYDSGQDGNAQFKVQLALDQAKVLTATGHLPTSQEAIPLQADIDIPGLPLAPANVFLPANMIRLNGTLQGNLSMREQEGTLRLNGGMQLSQTDAQIGMIGTSFQFAPDRIVIADNQVRFDRYQIFAPNKKALTIDGSVNLGDFSNITTDLRLTAADFQAIDVARGKGSMVYGKAFLDLNASVKGELESLLIRGNIGLLGGTEVTYVMTDSPLEVKQQSQNMVTFVSFSDTTAMEIPDSIARLQVEGMDIQMNVDVNNSVKMGVDLSEDGKNRIELQGGGNLSYTMNPLGDTRFSGRYEVSGGTVRYTPPIISQKIFNITPGSYVEWTGEMLDPSFNITAVETVQTNLTTEENPNESQQVKFNVSINIRNTLENLAITFDLSAPENLSIQNQLASLTAEQRANQAMSLLIYNTYTGPGTTAKTDSGNALDTFIEKQLNQWAQSSLKGVDLSFGIDSYDETETGGTQRTDYSYKLSKNLFNNRVRAIIGGKFSTDADPTENLKENLVDDISLEYMLTKRDNMFLKIFRHTGYESILEGEVTETGVGFVVRKKLLRLGDLFRFAKSKAQNQTEAHPAAGNSDSQTAEESEPNKNKK